MAVAMLGYMKLPVQETCTHLMDAVGQVDSRPPHAQLLGQQRKIYAAIILAVLDDAISDDKKYGNGRQVISSWARSSEGREILKLAGIKWNERIVQGMEDFVHRGIPTADVFPKSRKATLGTRFVNLSRAVAAQSEKTKVVDDLKKDLGVEDWLQAEFLALANQAKALSKSVKAATIMIEWQCKKLLRSYDGGH